MQTKLVSESERFAREIAYGVDGLNKYQQYALAQFLTPYLDRYGQDNDLLADLVEAFRQGFNLGKESSNWFTKKQLANVHRAYARNGADSLPKEWWKEADDGQQRVD